MQMFMKEYLTVSSLQMIKDALIRFITQYEEEQKLTKKKAPYLDPSKATDDTFIGFS